MFGTATGAVVFFIAGKLDALASATKQNIGMVANKTRKMY
jgi:hypothetical protein